MNFVDQIRATLAYDPETGAVTYLNGRGKGGSVDKEGYVQLSVGGRLIAAHRAIWGLMYGRLPSDQIDHINGIRADNRLVNLREATNAQNVQNTAKRAGMSSQYMGVAWNKRAQKWRATIKANGRQHFLGHFQVEEDARDAYLEAKSRLHTFQPTVRSMGQSMGRPAPETKKPLKSVAYPSQIDKLAESEG